MVLVVSGVAALALAYRQSAPSIVSRLASQYLGRHVEVEALEIELGQVLEVELHGVRVYPGDDASGEPLLEIPHAFGTQSWPRLLVGQLIPGKWQLASPVLRSDLGGGLGDKDRPLALPVLPPLDLSIQGGTVILRRGASPPLRITNIELTTTRARLRARVSGSAHGNLWVGDLRLGGFRANLEGWRENVTVETHLDGLDLSIAPLPFELPVRGLARGEVTLRANSGRVSGSVDLKVAAFELELPGFKTPIAPRSTQIDLDFEQEENAWTLRARPLALDDLVVTGALRIGTGPGARLSGALDLAEFRPGVPSLGRLHFVSLLGLRFKTWESFDRRIEAGVVESFHLELDVPLRELEDALAFRLKLAPEQLSGRAIIHGGVYRTGPDSAPLEQISGTIELSGNTLSMHEIRIFRSGEPLPEIDLTIDGLHRFAYLPAEERQRPVGPGTPLPGLGPGARALGSAEGPHPPPVIHFSDAQIGYPAFLLPIRDARGTIRFPGGRLWIEKAEAVVGGAPGRVSVLWDPLANTVAAQVVYSDDEAPPLRDPGPYWMSARIAVDPLYLGAWRLDQVHGWLYAEGATIEFRDLSGRYGSGPASGAGSVSLANPEGAEYDFRASVHHAEASALCEPLLRPEGSITGRLALDGRFAGRLDPNRSPLETADYGMAVRIEEGTLDELPATMVLARLPSLQGIRGLFGARLPFDALSADVAIVDGVLRTENMALQGSELRMHARGSIDLLSEQRETDMELAFLFLQTVDRVLGTLPILGSWVLGDDQSLVGVYLHLDGAWDDPRVRPVPPDAVQAAGWAVNLVAGGASQLFQFIFPRNSQTPQESPENARPPDTRPQQAP